MTAAVPIDLGPTHLNQLRSGAFGGSTDPAGQSQPSSPRLGLSKRYPNAAEFDSTLLLEL